MIMPFGYGEAQPIADNTTREDVSRTGELKILTTRVSTRLPASVGSVAISQPGTQQ
jgi:hypothetical protein